MGPQRLREAGGVRMKIADAAELHTTWAARGWKYVIDNPFGTV